MAPSRRWRSTARKIDVAAPGMRREPTEAEERLWNALRNRSLARAKFRRQHPIGRFILDFFCPAARLVIEVDGGIHADPDQAARDEARTLYLETLGYQVLCISNEEVLSNLPTVLERIATHLPTPFPPAGEGAGG